MIKMSTGGQTIKLSSLQKGLVLHLPLDQQSFNPATKRFTDKSACSNHGTGIGAQLGSVAPGFQADRMGQLVRSAPFNGSDDHIDCGVVSSYANDLITVEAWVNPTSGGCIWNYGTEKYINDQLGIENDGTIKFVIRGGAAATTNYYFLFSAVGCITFDSMWHHIVATYNRSGPIGKIYLDGIDVSYDDSIQAGNADILHPTNPSTYIGYPGYSTALYFNGNRADVRVYNILKSQEEITLLHESYRPGWKI